MCLYCRKTKACRTFNQFLADTNICINIFLACTLLIGVQVGIVGYCLKPAIELSPCYSEEPCKFALCHGYGSVSLVNNLHIIASIKVTALIGYACFSLCVITCIHAVSPFLSFGLTTNGIVLVFIVASKFTFAVLLSLALYLAMSLSISSEILLSVTCA